MESKLLQTRIGIVIVSHGHQVQVGQLLRSLQSQLTANDKVIIVDNHPDQQTAATISSSDRIIVSSQDNRGFAAACNLGVSKIRDSIDIVFLLNPDTVAGAGLLNELRKCDWQRYAACMPLLQLPDGRINSAGNIVHSSGLSWCDKLYGQASDLPIKSDVTALSGACTALSLAWWDKLQGMDENYFLYYEDVDLSTRIIAAGGKLQLLANVAVTHDYDFQKSTAKWFYIERNIVLYVLKTWPWPVILLLLPQNSIVSIGLWLMAIKQKRFIAKLRACLSTCKAVPAFVLNRKKVTRTISSYDFIRSLEPLILTPLAAGAVSQHIPNLIFKANYFVAKAILKLGAR